MDQEPQMRQLTDEETRILWKRDGTRLSRNKEPLSPSAEEIEEEVSYAMNPDLAKTVAEHLSELYKIANMVGEDCEELEVEDIMKSYQLNADVVSGQYMEDMGADMSSFLETFKTKWEALEEERDDLRAKNKAFVEKLQVYAKALRVRKKKIETLEKKNGISHGQYYRDIVLSLTFSGLAVAWLAMNNYLCPG